VILGTQFFVGHRRYLDVQVDPIEQWPANFAQVALDDRAGAAALVRGIGKEPARASVRVTVVQLKRPLSFPI
jgi:hypothetical protein